MLAMHLSLHVVYAVTFTIMAFVRALQPWQPAVGVLLFSVAPTWPRLWGADSLHASQLASCIMVVSIVYACLWTRWWHKVASCVLPVCTSVVAM